MTLAPAHAVVPRPVVPRPARPATLRAGSTYPADDLLMSARRSLTEASIAASAGERYAAAHLAALRAAAAVLAASGSPSKRSRVRSVWVVLPQVAAEFAEWAAFFAAGAGKRAKAEAGLPCVSSREADDLLRDAEAFVARVAQYLGVPHQSSMASVLLHVG
jgi:hypothetical protein